MRELQNKLKKGMRPILGGVLRNRPEIRGVLKIALKSYDFEKSTWNPGGT